MKYSIIVAVYNRLNEVKELLPTVEALDFEKADFELVFVDDGSQDGFKEYMQSYDSELRIQCLYQENKGPGEARNHGMRHANGEFILFVDSDCLLPNNWLREIDLQSTLYHYDAFGGPDTCHPSFSPLLKAINYSMTSFLGTGGTRGGSKKAVTKFFPRSFNMGISRKVYRVVGEMGKLRHGQDMDYSARIYAAGFKVGLIQEAFVYHKRRTSLKRFFKQVFNWGVARIKLAQIHPNMLKIVHLLPALLVAGLVASLLALAVFPNVITAALVGLQLIGFLILALMAFVQSLFQNKSLKVALLSPITLHIQVFAYGLGLWKAVLQFLFNKEVKGYTKNYYK